MSVTDPSTISEPIYRFLGNHTHSDYFKLLKKEANSLLIGARNMVYNLSLPTLEENKSRVRMNYYDTLTYYIYLARYLWMTTAKISLRINRGVVSQKRTEFTAAAERLLQST